MTTIGNSGFEYEEVYKKRSGYGKNNGAQRTCKIINIKTKEEIFTLIGTSYNYKSQSWKYIKNSPTKRFLGLDNRYYYIEVSTKRVDWGQIQSDGAILRSNRSILKVIAFFPNYKKPETIVPTSKPIVITEVPNLPKIITIPKTSLATKNVTNIIPDTTPVEEGMSWIQKIINWIMKIIKG